MEFAFVAVLYAKVPAAVGRRERPLRAAINAVIGAPAETAPPDYRKGLPKEFATHRDL